MIKDILQFRETTCDEGVVKCFLRVPQAMYGAALKLPWCLIMKGYSQKTYYKTFITSRGLSLYKTINYLRIIHKLSHELCSLPTRPGTTTSVCA